MSPDQSMILASAASYSIDARTGEYSPNIYGTALGYVSPPIVVNAKIAVTDADGTQDLHLINACLIGRTGNAVIVAFRGTLFGDNEDAFSDWLQDFLVSPVSRSGLPGKVHSGFSAAVRLMYRPIMAAVRTLLQQRKLPVYVTGHSKGGGLAPIFAYLMALDGIKPAFVTTFAAPKPGDAAFAAGYEKMIANHVRYENYGDLVPFLAPEDEVSEIIADVVAKIDRALADLIREAATWGYEPVGSEKFIESKADKYKVVEDETAFGQAIDIGRNIAAYRNVLSALAAAHHVTKGYGYMNGLCPGMFEAVEIDVVIE